MSDTPQGPGWWQASDGKFYPPQPPTAPTAPPPPPTSPYPAAGPTSYAAGPVGPPQGGGMSGCLKAFLIGVAVLFVLGVASAVVLAFIADDVIEDVADDLDDGVVGNNPDEIDDVDEPDCTTSDEGFMIAELEVTNDSSERSSYLITVTFSDGDNQLATGVASISSLDPDATATVEANTGLEPPGSFTCEVTLVERVSAE